MTCVKNFVCQDYLIAIEPVAFVVNYSEFVQVKNDSLVGAFGKRDIPIGFEFCAAFENVQNRQK